MPEFCTWEASPRVCLLRKIHFRLSQAFIEVSCWERPGILDWKLFTYHAEENWGALHHKFLPIACGRILVSYIQNFILICRLKSIHAPIIFWGWLFAWENLFDCLPWAYHILTLFRMITYFKHHALPSQNFVYAPYLWLKIYRWSCTWLVLLLTWSLLLWGFCTDVDLSY